MPKRLRILEDDEIEALYGLPRFTPEERSQFFALSPREKAALGQLHATKSCLYFILQLGYFKARHQFFIFSLSQTDCTSTVGQDAAYIRKRYFPDFHFTELEIAKVTRLKQQRLILNLCRYQTCNGARREALQIRARKAARICGKPVYIFRELMQHLAEQRMVAPGYSFLQDTIGQALTHEQNRLIGLVRNHLKEASVEAIEQLLDNTTGLYGITQLKREPKDFSLGQIKREIDWVRHIAPLYCLAQGLLPKLGISNESIIYYASMVDYYSVYKLKRLVRSVTHLYLLCFLSHRYQRLQDNLINCLLHDVKRYSDQAKAAAKERVYASHAEGKQNLERAAAVLKLFTDDTIATETPFGDVQTKAFGILERSQLDAVADHIAAESRLDEGFFQWEHIDTLAHQFKRHLRPLLCIIDFAAPSASDPLIGATCFLKTVFQKRKPLKDYRQQAFPLGFVPESAKRYLYIQDDREQRLLPDRYEFLVYRQLRKGLEAGDIFCRDSVRFRSLEDDLLDDKRWHQKQALISETGLSVIEQPIEDHLAALEKKLEARIVEVNLRISDGKNEHVEVKQRSSRRQWKLARLRRCESTNHPVFDVLRQVDIDCVLHFVNRHCRFMESFEHLLGRYVKGLADNRIITACLVAWGTNMGLGRMGQISDIGYQRLVTCSDNLIRLETVRKANDCISNAIAALPMFRLYDIGSPDDGRGAFHSSSDGQKFETRIHTFNARHSRKYFGLKKGIVSYTMVANHVPVNAEIIGANEHESHYVFDLLFNNTTKFQPDMHSTDTHGTNEVNFALLHLFGYQFAPRYKDIYERIRTGLYGFKHPRSYGEKILLRPIRKINTQLVVEEWEHIKRILVSLALKTTRQSIIIGKLSAHARKNKTKRALWEYDNIIRSLYLLEYVDSLTLRRNVERALNRGESYHQLRRAVSYANFGKLRFRTEHEQQLWSECGRLLTNCIIYYNTLLLSHLWTSRQTSGDAKGAASLGRVSPVAWQHVNFYGRYEFSKTPAAIDLEEVVKELAGVSIEEEPLA